MRERRGSRYGAGGWYVTLLTDQISCKDSEWKLCMADGSVIELYFGIFFSYNLSGFSQKYEGRRDVAVSEDCICIFVDNQVASNSIRSRSSSQCIKPLRWLSLMNSVKLLWVSIYIRQSVGDSIERLAKIGVKKMPISCKQRRSYLRNVFSAS